MTTKRKIAGTVSDPLLPKTPVTIDGKTYNLCFDLGALAEAETAINGERARKGEQPLNLLMVLPAMNLANIRIVFAAALRKFHPEIDFEKAQKMLTLSNLYDVATRIREAWDKSSAAGEDTPNPPVGAE